MSVDTAFRSVNPRAPGFYVWRIEKLKVCSVPKQQYGSFFCGDSYIILSVQDVKGRLDSHIHFWLGKETSQDEAGVAAYKSVELDDYLGGAPVQHREVQDKESTLFRSYFKQQGLKYMMGGVSSGFNHVTHTFKVRLLHIKGKKHISITEVPVAWSQFNSGDVFILDLGQVIFVWLGKECSRTEKIHGLEQARKLRDERSKVNVYVVEDGKEDDMPADEKKLFEAHLSLSERKVKTKQEGGDDETAETKSHGNIKLYRCTEEKDKLQVLEVKSGPLVKSDLDTKDAFIIDNGEQGIWTWKGKQASRKERDAMRNALGYIKKKGYSNSTPVSSVVEGGEPAAFKWLFKSWPEAVATGKAYTQNKVAKTVQTKFDASTLHTNRQLAAQTQMVDDGMGSTQVWRVKGTELEGVPTKNIGKFFAGDCYVILYTYEAKGKNNYILYYWQGNKSTTEEKGVSALKTVEMDDKLNGAAVQVRVVQNKEPPHFYCMFDGKMITFSEGSEGSVTGGPKDTYVLQVRGTNELNTRAVQVPLSAESLNSNDVFVVFLPSTVYIWCGKGSTGDEREAAKLVAKRSNRDFQIVVEGQEKPAFWEALGGKKEYASDKRLADADSSHPARLFQISNASGKFVVDEIYDFCQEDCCEDDVMMLDAYDALYIWVGEGARPEEISEANKVAVEYLKADPTCRDADTPIIRIKQRFEPPTFTGFFGFWDDDLWNNGQSYTQLSAQLIAENEPIELTTEQLEANGGTNFDNTPKYPLEDLQVLSEELPAGVDPSSREIYLSETDFQRAFNMDYQTFISKPNWKQQDMKKQNKLF